MPALPNWLSAEGFELSDDGRTWVAATALIDGGTVVCSAVEGFEPRFVRYGYRPSPCGWRRLDDSTFERFAPSCNLYCQAGGHLLPAPVFSAMEIASDTTPYGRLRQAFARAETYVLDCDVTFPFKYFWSNANRTFGTIYARKWWSVTGKVVPAITALFDGFDSNGLTAKINASRQKDARRWNAATYRTVANDRALAMDWFEKRVDKLNSLISAPSIRLDVDLWNASLGIETDPDWGPSSDRPSSSPSTARTGSVRWRCRTAKPGRTASRCMSGRTTSRGPTLWIQTTCSG